MQITPEILLNHVDRSNRSCRRSIRLTDFSPNDHEYSSQDSPNHRPFSIENLNWGAGAKEKDVEEGL